MQSKTRGILFQSWNGITKYSASLAAYSSFKRRRQTFAEEDFIFHFKTFFFSTRQPRQKVRLKIPESKTSNKREIFKSAWQFQKVPDKERFHCQELKHAAVASRVHYRGINYHYLWRHTELSGGLSYVLWHALSNIQLVNLTDVSAFEAGERAWWKINFS